MNYTIKSNPTIIFTNIEDNKSYELDGLKSFSMLANKQERRITLNTGYINDEFNSDILNNDNISKFALEIKQTVQNVDTGEVDHRLTELYIDGLSYSISTNQSGDVHGITIFLKCSKKVEQPAPKVEKPIKEVKVEDKDIKSTPKKTESKPKPKKTKKSKGKINE